MKLRIRGNSIRLRLTRSEVENFAAAGITTEVVQFGNQNFSYALEKSSAPNLSASFENGKMTVFVPTETADGWAAGERVGLESTDGELRILVEKDFVCLNPRKDEAEDDNFPHPHQDQSC